MYSLSSIPLAYKVYDPLKLLFNNFRYKPLHMFRRLLAFFITGCSLAASAQYKNDNVAFKTIDPSDLCATLEKNKGYILLDVRSKGEHYDTSQ